MMSSSEAAYSTATQPPSSSQYSQASSEYDREPDMYPFSANDDGHRYLRKRCEVHCTAFNAQPASVSREERAEAWNAYVLARQILLERYGAGGK